MSALTIERYINGELAAEQYFSFLAVAMGDVDDYIELVRLMSAHDHNVVALFLRWHEHDNCPDPDTCHGEDVSEARYTFVNGKETEEK